MRRYEESGKPDVLIGTLSTAFLREAFTLSPRESRKVSPILEVKTVLSPKLLLDLFSNSLVLDIRLESQIEMYFYIIESND